MSMKQYVLMLLFIVSMSACNTHTRECDMTVPVPVQRIDLFVSDGLGTADSLQPGLDMYFKLMGVDSVDCDVALDMLRGSEVTKVFGADVRSRFSAADSIGIELGKAKKRLSDILPDIKISQVYGVVTPYMQSVMVSDSVIFVALNHYLGADYPGYSMMPVYSARFKVPQRVVPDVVEALVRINYPYEPCDGTLLERMLYEGAVVKVVSTVLDNDWELALGYSADQLKEADDEREAVWKALAVHRLLYSDSPVDISSFFDLSPFTRVGDIVLPPRIGRYIGLSIIESYLGSHPGVSLSYLLSRDFYGKSQSGLIESHYTAE